MVFRLEKSGGAQGREGRGQRERREKNAPIGEARKPARSFDSVFLRFPIAFQVVLILVDDVPMISCGINMLSYSFPVFSD